MWLALGLLLPLSGTVLGAAMVFLLRGEWSARWNKLLLGFASGVMVAASVWSLLIPTCRVRPRLLSWRCGLQAALLVLCASRLGQCQYPSTGIKRNK